MSSDLSRVVAEEIRTSRVKTCVYCGSSLGPFHYDHVVPRSRGGPDSPANIVTACAACNMSKHDRLPSEWLNPVPPFVASIERRICESVQVRIKAKRTANKARQARNRDASAPACFFCGVGVSKRDGFLEIYDQEIGVRDTPRLDWPGNGGPNVRNGLWRSYRTIAIFTHQACGPDYGYWIPFDRLNEDWENHLAKKRWYCFEVHDALATARTFCGTLPPRQVRED